MMRLFPLGRRIRDPETAGGVPRCGRNGHVVAMQGLRLQTPTTLLDVHFVLAAASDSQAQRWLGPKPEDVVPEPHRQRLLNTKPGQGPSFRGGTARESLLVVIDPELDRLAGAVSYDRNTGEIGGWLAPEFRGRGLGSVMFAGAAELQHRHLGFATVIAGAEPSNRASIGALTSAGFTPTTGPATHTLPDGREVPGAWFRHDCHQPARCAWRGL